MKDSSIAARKSHQEGRRLLSRKDRDINLIHSVLKNISGFLNTRGGDLVIGISDKSREAVGIEFDNYKGDEEYVKRISKAIENNFKNKTVRYLCNVSLVEIEKKKVCCSGSF